MADVLAANDARFASLNAAVQEIVNLLKITYIVGGQIYDCTQAKPPFPAHLWALTPHAAGIHVPHDSVELACMATISKKTFFAYVSETLELDEEIKPERDCLKFKIQDVKSLRTSDHAIEIRKAKIVVRYQLQPQDFEADAVTMPTSFAVRSNDDTSDVMSRIFDTQTLLQTLKCQDSNVDTQAAATQIRRAYLRFHQWAENSGICHEELGMLNTACLLQTFVTALSALSAVGQPPDESDEEILHRMFASGAIFLEGRDDGTSFRVIKSPSGRNEAQHISIDGDRIIHRALMRTGRKVWCERQLDLIPTRQIGLQTFIDEIDESNILCKLTARCWNTKHREPFRQWMYVVLRQFQSEVPVEFTADWSAKIWPYAVEGDSDDASGDLVYLINVHQFDDAHHELAITPTSALNSISAKLRYNRDNMYVEVGLASNDDASAAISTAAEGAQEDGAAVHLQAAMRTVSLPTFKLRTAGSAMNRLRWDEKHRNIDYEVGYVDRFEVDLIWKALEQWEKLVEEEEFVPEHRIRQIRRIDDKHVVWDRAKRFDGTSLEAV